MDISSYTGTVLTISACFINPTSERPDVLVGGTMRNTDSIDIITVD